MSPRGLPQMLIVSPGHPSDAPARALLEESHALMLFLFPAEENYALDVEDLMAPEIRFFIARDGQTVLGTGALQIRPGYGEVKSMFTDRAARGRGVAAALLRQIEDEARANALPVLRLETGEALHAAMRLYERHGFNRCGRFGDYPENETSVFMEKRLDASPPDQT